MKVKKAEKVAILDRVLKVLGSEQTQESTVQMAEKPTVQTALLDMVLRYFAPVKTWRPWNYQMGFCRFYSLARAYLNESIVKDEQYCCEIPNPSPAIVEHLPNITHISKLRMTETEFPSICVRRCSTP